MGLLDNQTQEQYYSGSEHGGYQFTSLQNIIDQFIIAYVGEEKIISKARKPEVVFHAQRAMQEFSFDTFKSVKSVEIDVPNTLTMTLPQDYVNYVRLSWVDDVGVFHTINPSRITGNPTSPKQGGSIGNENFEDSSPDDGNIDLNANSTSWDRFKANSQNVNIVDYFQYDEDHLYNANEGGRYGLDPEHANINGTYYIDENKGMIHFSSHMSGRKIVLEYISDGLGTDAEMKVHKFAEEAMYKQIAYAILSTRANTPEYIVQRYKKDAFASKRVAKLRLSNIKLPEIIAVMRGKSKQIKH
jgi:hypothetical protein